MATDRAIATWCVTHGRYADPDCGTGHVHYDVTYDAFTGVVLTSSGDQELRRAAAILAAISGTGSVTS